MTRLLSPSQRMEQCLLTDMRKPIWRPFMRSIRDYRLLSPRPGRRVHLRREGFHAAGRTDAAAATPQ